MKIGVLALQGAFAEHVSTLHAIGVEAVEVRLPADLVDVDGLILPGGESTTMRRLIDRWGLRQPILDLAESGAPLFGTCAGMIVLAREITSGEEAVLPLLDITVERNAFGRQLDSFETELVVPLLGDRPVHAVFIRAPVIERVGPRRRRDRQAGRRPDRRRARAEHRRHGVPSRARRGDALPSPGRDARGRARGPGRGRRAPAAPHAPRAAGPLAMARKVRAARLTDLAALGELSRLAQADGDGTRSLGLPVTGPRIGMFSLFRLPLGAFSPNDVMYVFDRDGHVAGLLRAERDSPRDEWTVVELDAVGDLDAGDVRFRLVQHLLRDGGKRGAVRFHVACGDVDDNVELFMQAGFIRFGDEHVLFREPDDPLPPPMAEDEARAARIRPAAALDAVPLSRLYATVTPAPVQRLEDVRIPDWERQGRDWRVPRSSLAPILRFADVDAFVQESDGGGRDGTQLDAFVQIGVAKEDQPHYLKVHGAPGGGHRAGDPVRAGHHRGRRGIVGHPPRRARARPHLRVADRPPSRRGGLCLDRDRHAAHEGDPRPGRRAAPRAGGRPMTEDPVRMPDDGARTTDEGGPIGVGTRERQRETMDDLDVLLAALPPEIVEAIHALADRETMIEVVLDLGRRPEARYPSSEVTLLDREIGDRDIAYVVDHIGSFGDDNRAGIERTLHRISAIRNRNGKIVGLTCRIGRAVYGTIEIISDYIETGKSILIMGRPGIGKTTMLREAARVLAEEQRKRVVVVDTSNEIAGDGDIPHPAIGKARRMQVRTPSLQHEVMIEAVENHMPQVIVIDEIGTELEAQAARTIAERGVQLIGTAHGNNLDNLMLNPTLSDLIGGIQSVTLGDEEARRRRSQKSVLERKAPPTFDCIVEIQDRERVLVHADVAATVDALLLGEPVAPELRWRDEEGVHRSQSRPKPSAREAAGGDRFSGLTGSGAGAWGREPGWRGAGTYRTGLRGRRPPARPTGVPAGPVGRLALGPGRVGIVGSRRLLGSRPAVHGGGPTGPAERPARRAVRGLAGRPSRRSGRAVRRRRHRRPRAARARGGRERRAVRRRGPGPRRARAAAPEGVARGGDPGAQRAPRGRGHAPGERR